MLLTLVKGHVVSTAKLGSLSGKKLLLVEIVVAGPDGLHSTGRNMVCIDAVGAGEGELVLTVMGSSARLAPGMGDVPADAVIVGIVDTLLFSGNILSLKEQTA